MGYSSSYGTLLQALSVFNADVESANAGVLSLEAHGNQSGVNGPSSRLGQLKTVSGGVNAGGDYVHDVNVRFFPFYSSNGASDGRVPYSNVSIQSGPWTSGRFYHIWTTTAAWISVGDAATIAVLGRSYPVMPNTVYPFYPGTIDATNLYLNVVRDTVDGILYLGEVDR